MGLLAEIQTSLLNEQPLGPILLRLRFLGARLGSTALEEWVKHESEGYPRDAKLPSYREFGVSYTGSFNGIGSKASNIPIPPLLIREYAGQQWLTHAERQSIAAVEDLLNTTKDGQSNLGIDASNLILVLNGKVFPGMACHAVKGHISRAALAGMVATLRARVMEFTLTLEGRLPEAREITAGHSPQSSEPEQAAVVTTITNQTFYGAVASNVANSGSHVGINVAVRQHDINSVTEALKQGGISEDDAKEFAEILASEKPESSDQPFGARAKEWVAKNLPKALNGTWKAGIAVATGVLTEAAKKYYGMG